MTDYQDSEENVIYITDEEAAVTPIGEEIELAGTSFRVIGYGWMVPLNFYSVIDPASPQEVFEIKLGYQMISHEELEAQRASRTIRIIPYSAFRDSFEPELVLVRFPGRNHSAMMKITKEVQSLFPDCAVTKPAASSVNYYIQALGNAFAFILLFLPLSAVALLIVMQEFIRKQRGTVRIYRTAGLSQRSGSWLLLSEIAVLLALGDLIALAVQFFLMPVLSFLDAGSMPGLAEILISWLVLFFLVLLFSLGEIKRSQTTWRNAE